MHIADVLRPHPWPPGTPLTYPLTPLDPQDVPLGPRSPRNVPLDPLNHLALGQLKLGMLLWELQTSAHLYPGSSSISVGPFLLYHSYLLVAGGCCLMKVDLPLIGKLGALKSVIKMQHCNFWHFREPTLSVKKDCKNAYGISGCCNSATVIQCLYR